jgi:hypothetical protein
MVLPLIEPLLKLVAEEIIKIVVSDLAKQPRLASLHQALQGDAPEKAAFQRALLKSYLSFQKQHPDLAGAFFDEVYLSRPDVQVELAKVLQTGQQPQADVLITAWQAQFNKAPAVDMQAPVTGFLNDLHQAVWAEKDLKPFVDSAALHQLYAIAKSGRSQEESGQRTVEILKEIHALLAGQLAPATPATERRRKPRSQSGSLRSDEYLNRLAVCLERLNTRQFKRLQNLALSPREIDDLTTPVTRKSFLQDLRRWERDYLVRLENSLLQGWGELLADVLNPAPGTAAAPAVSPVVLAAGPTTHAPETTVPVPPRAVAPANGIQFVNRSTELHTVLGYHLYNKHWVIDAPAGYGKSMFMGEVRRRLTDLNWRSYWIRREDWPAQSIQGLARAIVLQLGCDQVIDSRRGPKAMGRKVASCILESLQRTDAPSGDAGASGVTGIAFMLDTLNEMENSALEQLDEFVGGIDEGLENGGYFDSEHYISVFAAGRYLKRKIWSSDRFDTCDLSPYQYSAVRDTVSRYIHQAGVNWRKPRLNAISAQLFYETGGHPGCMASILGQLAGDHFANLNELNAITTAQVDELLFPAIAEIESEFPQEQNLLLDALQVLSVFRKSRAWFLNRLIKYRLIVWPADGDDLEQQLKRTHLVQWNDGFLQDDITRRLLALRLRRQHPERFAQICERAAKLYPQYLKRLSNPRRPEIICQEWLFQTVQKGALVDGLRGAELRQRIEEVLAEIVSLLCCRWGANETLWDLKDSLKKDWELAFMCNYFLCTDGYCENIYPELINRVPDKVVA